MKDLYVYPAIFNFADDGISISFPDLPGCLSCANTDEEAFYMARDVLEGHIYCLEQDNDNIPNPTALKDIHLNSNETVVLIKAFMLLVRNEMSNKAIKKTLTIPNWLNNLAEKEKINFSQILQVALKERLGIKI